MAPFMTIGTRGSPLALWQAHHVRGRLAEIHGIEENDIAVEVIKTTGDRILDRPLSQVGGKGLFTKELEEAMLDGHIDIAVHSSKDVATVLPDGLFLSAYLKREDVRDAFISPHCKTLNELPEGATVGTASLRRQALVRRLRPDLIVETFRGNVQTRLRKLDDGEVDATLLALAGLRRLEMEHVASSLLSLDDFPPAIGQGCVCIESRVDNDTTTERLAPLNDPDARDALVTERAFLRELDGSCRTPIAGLALPDADRIAFHGLIASLDGQTVFESEAVAGRAEAEELGRETGKEVRAKAGETFMANLAAQMQ
ncbi:MAG: hydroxymethylbilane synthase [Pseudomonadota bacterium]